MDAYIKGCQKRLCDKEVQKVCDGVYCSLFNELSLGDYVKGRKAYCALKHAKSCTSCKKMLEVASIVLQEGYCSLSRAFSIVSPNVKYTPDRARFKLLQMPLVSICIGSPSTGLSRTILIEYSKGCDYTKMKLVVSSLAQSPRKQPFIPDKDCIKALLNLAQSDRERECLRYAVYKSSGLSSSAARKQYGFENMDERSKKVEEAILEAKRIHEAVNDIASVQDKCLLAQFGIVEESGSNTDDTDTECSTSLPELTSDKIDLCKKVLTESCFNWFALQEELESRYGSECAAILEKFFSSLPTYNFTDSELQLIIQSKEAYTAACIDAYDSERTARALNGLIVTESDSDCPPECNTLNNLFDENGVALIKKRRLAIQRRNRRLRAKAITEQRLLSRKSTAKTSKILNECSDIGKVVEDFVTEHNCGADAWRRTGVLTFDGNTKLPEKITYERIRQHLMKVYKRSFSYGTVVQLCVSRNRRRISSKRYRGVANVTTRRARKGFSLKYNPDSHWSAAFYKGLNSIELKDGRDIVNLNRDDASGFRLDTLTTCSQYSSPTVKGNDIKTTRTDYVNKYPSVLQVTSYNFTGTESISEICAGVVKAPSSIHPKNPCQHAQDLIMLEEQEILKSAFLNPITGLPKAIDAIRVDGASDEGPSHEEVQFYWTERHLLKNKLATIVTTRSSGSSYKNRVELQNGCLSRGHSNTFIPSTIAGSNIDQERGTVDKDKLKENMSLAVDAYISRVDGCPCGNSNIHLFRGPQSEEKQLQRDKLLIFLKGSKKKKEALAKSDPSDYSHFDIVWRVRKNHMVLGLPSYIFFLMCCYTDQCPHPRCQGGQPTHTPTWYPGGPPLCNLPLPVPDQERPWGGTNCNTCKDFCSGHYRSQLVDVTDCNALSQFSMPPSVELNKYFTNSRGVITDDEISRLAKSVLLPPDEVRMWLDHLETIRNNRTRGAQKAAATRSAKRTIAQTVSNIAAVQSTSRGVEVRAIPQSHSNVQAQSTVPTLTQTESNTNRTVAAVQSTSRGVEVRVIPQSHSNVQAQSTVPTLTQTESNTNRTIAAVQSTSRGVEVRVIPQSHSNVQAQSTVNKSAPTLAEDKWWCGACGKQYEEETEEVEEWIECGVCKMWFHLLCTSLSHIPSVYVCTKCQFV